MVARFNLPIYERGTTPIKTDYYTKRQASIDDQVLSDLPYNELVGCLIYVMVCTRPDIAFCVSSLTTYFSSPKKIYWETALHCLGYLAATDTHGLTLRTGGDLSITSYSDLDLASNPLTRRSIRGHLVYFGRSVISWSRKTLKGSLALSTTESEYVNMALSISTGTIYTAYFSRTSISKDL